MQKHIFVVFLFSIVKIPGTIVPTKQVSFEFKEGPSCGKRSSKFRSLTEISLDKCLLECGARPHCKAINFRRLFSNLCELLSNTTTTMTRERSCLFIKREDVTFNENVSILFCILIKIRHLRILDGSDYTAYKVVSN